jgi:hypothetical protein
MLLTKNTDVRFFNTHPLAFKQQSVMIEKLKELPNYVETEIYHDWNKSTDTVTWLYSFEESTDSSWENTVLQVIKKYEQPS